MASSSYTFEVTLYVYSNHRIILSKHPPRVVPGEQFVWPMPTGLTLGEWRRRYLPCAQARHRIQRLDLHVTAFQIARGHLLYPLKPLPATAFNALVHLPS